MHIMEGFLPVKHAVGWTVVSAPFVVSGIKRVRMQLQESPESKLLLSAAGAYAFVLSALKLPSATGSSSHPTGLGLGSILFGPQVMSVIGMMTLLFQALLLAHGGLTTYERAKNRLYHQYGFHRQLRRPIHDAGLYRLQRWGAAVEQGPGVGLCQL